MEIIFYWLDTRDNITEQGYNFSPEVKCNLKVDLNDFYTLTVISTNKINIMREKNISNVTVLLGMNGAGKTTVMKNLSGLDCFRENKDDRREYADYAIEKNKHNRCLYVVKEIVKAKEKDKAKYYIITNIRKEKLTIESELIDKEASKYYSDDGDRLSNDLRNCIGLFGLSVIYLSNASYVLVDKGIGTHKGIEYISCTPNGMESIAKAFFDFICPETTKSNDNLLFYQYSNMLKESKKPGQFQQVCDIYSYEALWFNGGVRKENSVLMKQEYWVLATDIFKLLEDFNTIDIIRSSVTVFREIEEKYDVDTAKDSITYILKANFIVEYLMYAKEYKIGDGSNIDGIYENIKEYLQEDDRNDEMLHYFKNAITEIEKVTGIVKGGHLPHNTVPKSDYAYKAGIILNEEGFRRYAKLIEECTEDNNKISLNPKKYKYGSFIMRYLGVENLYLSSGERAFQNLMSWLYWISKMGDITSTKRVRPRKKILLMIDEIDALCHPSMQRDIIGDVIETIDNSFDGFEIQLVISTHSPLCLSNVPTENIMYLKRDNDKGIYQDESPHNQTFGRNIYDLLNDSFYLNGKTIGNYAVKYINAIIKDIKEKDTSYLYENKKKIWQKIDYIGDLLIKEKLYQLFDERMQALYKDKFHLLSLRHRQQIINEEISKLEKKDD